MTALAGMPIGFVGLGKIGSPMARGLYDGGAALTVYDLDPAQVARFAEEHPDARTAVSLRELGEVEVAITSLPDSNAVESVVLGSDTGAGLIDILSPGAFVIDMSSSDPMRSRSLAAELAARGLHFLDAPVSGGVTRAATGSLAIMVGGDPAHFELRRSIFEQLGTSVTFVGDAGAGHALKALNNYVSATGLLATAEALLVGEAFGLDPATMVEVLNGSTGRNFTTENKAKQFMLSGTFASGFSLDLMSKDIRTARQLATSLGWKMRLGAVVSDIWSEAAEELRSADHTEMYRYLQVTESG